MPISSSDDTQVVAQVRLGKLVRFQGKSYSKNPILALLLFVPFVSCSQSVVSSQSIESFSKSGERLHEMTGLGWFFGSRTCL